MFKADLRSAEILDSARSVCWRSRPGGDRRIGRRFEPFSWPGCRSVMTPMRWPSGSAKRPISTPGKSGSGPSIRLPPSSSALWSAAMEAGAGSMSSLDGTLPSGGRAQRRRSATQRPDRRVAHSDTAGRRGTRRLDRTRRAPALRDAHPCPPQVGGRAAERTSTVVGRNHRCLETLTRSPRDRSLRWQSVRVVTFIRRG